MAWNTHKVVTRGEIEDADWSLTPGRYVGVAPVAEDEDFDFQAAVTEVRDELAVLNAEATLLMAKVQSYLSDIAT